MWSRKVQIRCSTKSETVTHPVSNGSTGSTRGKLLTRGGNSPLVRRIFTFLRVSRVFYAQLPRREECPEPKIPTSTMGPDRVCLPDSGASSWFRTWLGFYASWTWFRRRKREPAIISGHAIKLLMGRCLTCSKQESDIRSREWYPFVVVMSHPPLGSAADFKSLGRTGLRRRNLEPSSRAAISWVHLPWLRGFIKIVCVDCERLIFVAPPPANPYRKIVRGILHVPARCQIVEREFCPQGLDDCVEVPDKCPDGLVADIREFFLHILFLKKFS